MQFVAQGITAIAQPAHLTGATAAELLLKRLAGGAAPFQHLVLATHLVERNSIAVHVQLLGWMIRGPRRGQLVCP
ncbi:substrate-binding domain-containing protein [Mesorhizobium sp.]|uniref:substrate-binding domain-containing protein n=1 Tax=Mesorhizobium sp. TaxID=1871066 RepID=UPI0025DFE1DF|nr:substrate-binding domain-containing protein [Mesorhizobium sp.]